MRCCVTNPSAVQQVVVLLVAGVAVASNAAEVSNSDGAQASGRPLMREQAKESKMAASIQPHRSLEKASLVEGSVAVKKARNNPTSTVDAQDPAQYTQYAATATAGTPAPSKPHDEWSTTLHPHAVVL